MFLGSIPFLVQLCHRVIGRGIRILPPYLDRLEVEIGLAEAVVCSSVAVDLARMWYDSVTVKVGHLREMAEEAEAPPAKEKVRCEGTTPPY
jgi:hypothetical protein